MEINRKWIYEYIDDIDLSNIEWVKFNINQLKEFYDTNYLVMINEMLLTLNRIGEDGL